MQALRAGQKLAALIAAWQVLCLFPCRRPSSLCCPPQHVLMQSYFQAGRRGVCARKTASWMQATPAYAWTQAEAGERPGDAEVAARLGMGRGELVAALLHAGARAHGLLLSANTGLVHKVARQFRGAGVPHEDLVQVQAPAGMCLLRIRMPLQLAPSHASRRSPVQHSGPLEEAVPNARWCMQNPAKGALCMFCSPQ